MNEIRTSAMHHKPHAPEHMVRVYDMDGSRGHLTGPFIDGAQTGECAGPVDGPVKGY